ncbi:MAG: gephyrin-like molybdotransferase Glp [Pseudorhodoplanes sp.]
MALLPVADALSKVLDGVSPLPSEIVDLPKAYGRVLTADLKALRTQPPAAMSAMDGYAVRGEDVATANTALRIVGEIAAGNTFTGTIGKSEAVRIFTGGVLPAGADTVVIQEDTERQGDRVTVKIAALAGRHVRRAGLDFSEGDALLSRGHRLSGRDLSLAAAMNHSMLPVHRRPRVAVFATGDELVRPGHVPGPGQIVYSNGYSLMALIRGEGGELHDLGIVPDRVDETVAAIRQARAVEADILLTTGGASVGEYDLVQQALVSEGLKLSFWKLALRPGKPMMHGRLGGMHVLGVPGNPVSSYVCSFLFLVPLLRRLAGRTDLALATESARLGTALKANDERADYLRARLDTAPDGGLTATPFPVQDSSMLAPLAGSGCLIIRDPFDPAAPTGAPCRIAKLPL